VNEADSSAITGGRRPGQPAATDPRSPHAPGGPR